MFDSLAGMELFHYAKRNADQDLVDSEDVRELRLRAKDMDLHRSEMMLLFLVRSSCEAAHAYLAEFLQHPNVSLRFIASKHIAKLPRADEAVMQAIVQALDKGGEPGLREEFDEILHRPANEGAKMIAETFIAKEIKG